MNVFLRAARFAAAFLCVTVAAAAAELVPTVISSDQADMVSTDTETTFTFEGNVVVTGTNLRITCERLVVVANRSGDPKATFGEQEKFKSLVATGKVHIVQSDREAFCDRAEVLPGEDKAVLTGNPRVQSTDGEYTAKGPKLILLRGQRRAIIEGGRTEITLPTIKDLGYEKDAEKTEPPAQPPAQQP